MTHEYESRRCEGWLAVDALRRRDVSAPGPSGVAREHRAARWHLRIQQAELRMNGLILMGSSSTWDDPAVRDEPHDREISDWNYTGCEGLPSVPPPGRDGFEASDTSPLFGGFPVVATPARAGEKHSHCSLLPSVSHVRIMKSRRKFRQFRTNRINRKNRINRIRRPTAS